MDREFTYEEATAPRSVLGLVDQVGVHITNTAIARDVAGALAAHVDTQCSHHRLKHTQALLCVPFASNRRQLLLATRADIGSSVCLAVWGLQQTLKFAPFAGIK